MTTRDQVPGVEQAYQAVRQVGGILLTEDAARQLVTVVAAVLRPHLQAEILADLADDPVIAAAAAAHEPDALSLYLDHTSHALRERLAHGPR